MKTLVLFHGCSELLYTLTKDYVSTSVIDVSGSWRDLNVLCEI